ncbi:hypothetical protein CRE_00389 [Caenorhabditis remanei]|uniref:Uncharacterized protein n=1 Tax=Caenorhabditis remanei TaxID=31234 RepID=E3LEV8_CAERE|nr:hypothetical protein CRE_00389 [Caenorhabditis remanei]
MDSVNLSIGMHLKESLINEVCETKMKCVKITMKTAENTNKVLANFQKIKSSVPELSQLSARPDLSKMDIIKFRHALKDAIKKNNVAGENLYSERHTSREDHLQRRKIIVCKFS